MRECPRCGYPAFETGDTEPHEMYFVCTNAWLERVRYKEEGESANGEGLVI